MVELLKKLLSNTILNKRRTNGFTKSCHIYYRSSSRWNWWCGGGGKIIDVQTGGPERRMQAEATELRLIVREEIKKALWEAWPEKTGGVKGLKKDPGKDYRETTPSR